MEQVRDWCLLAGGVTTRPDRHLDLGYADAGFQVEWPAGIVSWAKGRPHCHNLIVFEARTRGCGLGNPRARI
jgi:hypothetical protein